ncbi:MAG: HD domain-containing protein [Parvibaculaceae bacterium]|nr:HD domain-containing protein [Parvibaculaceae bacterium]
MKQIVAAWAKLKKTNSGILMHSLVAHSADVGAVMERLLADPVIAARLAQLAGLKELTPVMKARLSLLAAIHDAGKANVGFNNKRALEEGASFSDIGKLVAGHVGPVVNLMHPGNVYRDRDRPKSYSLFVDAMGLDRVFD